MKFAVLNKKALNIRDPDSKEPIGSIDLPKALVKVVRVAERVSVARTYRMSTRNIGGTLAIAALGRMLEPPKWVEVPETLKLDEGYQAEIDEKESFFNIGAPITEIQGDEYEMVEDE